MFVGSVKGFVWWQLLIDCYIVVVDSQGVILIGYVVLEILFEFYISFYLVEEIDCLLDQFVCLLCVMVDNDVKGCYLIDYCSEVVVWCELIEKIVFCDYCCVLLDCFWQYYCQIEIYNLIYCNCFSIVVYVLEVVLEGVIGGCDWYWFNVVRMMFMFEIWVVSQICKCVVIMVWIFGMVLDYVCVLCVVVYLCLLFWVVLLYFVLCQSCCLCKVWCIVCCQVDVNFIFFDKL